jgi:phosphodiesterase/alkaline phosphatase D-like protein
VVFAFSSCNGYIFDNNFVNAPENGIYPLNEDGTLDLNLCIGDNVYSDYFYSDPNPKITRRAAAVTLDQYNTIYAQRFFNVDKIRIMNSNTLGLYVSDDHEVFNDYADFYRSFVYSIDNPISELQLTANVIYSLYALGGDTTLVSPIVTSQEDNYNLWSIITPPYTESVNNGLTAFKNNISNVPKYYNFNYGTDVEFFILDVRSDRTPMKPNDNSQVLSIMSDEQFTWLKSSLSASTARIKFIVSSTVFSDVVIIPPLPGISDRSIKVTFDQLYNTFVHDPTVYTPLITLNGAMPDALTFYQNLTMDQKYRVFGAAMSFLDCGNWMYYDKSNTIQFIPQSKKVRTELIEHIQTNKISGVFILSGDLHSSFVSYTDDPCASFPLLELSFSPSGSPGDNKIFDYMRTNPGQKQFLYVANQKNFGTVETDLDNELIIVTFVKIDGTQDVIRISLKDYEAQQYGSVVTIN